MADMIALFGTLLALGIMFPGMLTAWWLLFPNVVERARVRQAHSLWRCLWFGAVVGVVLLVPIALLLAMPANFAKVAGGLLLVMGLALASIGLSGLAFHMGNELGPRSVGSLSPAAGFVRGAVTLELAIAFPIIGWFVVAPVVTIASLGATAFALLHWEPRQSPVLSDSGQARSAPAQN